MKTKRPPFRFLRTLTPHADLICNSYVHRTRDDDGPTHRAGRCNCGAGGWPLKTPPELPECGKDRGAGE